MVESNRSWLNPTDALVRMGRIAQDPPRTVRDLLAREGIDVDGPIEQLAQFADRELSNAHPLGKMRNIADGAHVRPGAGAAAAAAAPAPAAAAPAPAAAAPSLDTLLGVV